MAEWKPTEQQREAVCNEGGALLVSAAAGSGKTKVLVERLMRYVTDEKEPHGIGDFLIITYTKAAAAELRCKIREALYARLAEEPGNRRLRHEADMCARAHIETIHSFCVDILRENAHELGISPDFRVIDEGESDMLRREVLDRLLEEQYDAMKPGDGFSVLVDVMAAGRDDRRLVELVLETYLKLQCHPYPEKWAAEQQKALEADGVRDLSETAWGRLLMQRAEESIRYWLARLRELTLWADGAFLAAYGPPLEETCAALERFLEAKTWDAALAAADIPFGSGRVKGCDAEKEERTLCKKAIEKALSAFNADSETLLGDIRASAVPVRELLRLVSAFSCAYAEEKRRRGLLDFSDQEHMAVKLLCVEETGEPTAAAREIAGRFREIMIDEYQDVNAVQELIFRAVSQEGKNLFMVGDVKQSIYRFRLADPGIFLGKYRQYAPAAEAGEGEPRKVLLQKNFRSRPAVLEAVNYVFSNVMSESFGEMAYAQDERLYPGASFPESDEPCVELDVLDLFSDDDDADEPSPVKTEAEASYAAGRIEEMLGIMKVSDGQGGLRPAEYRDFAILMRRVKGDAAVFASELLRRGIPVSTDSGSSESLDAPEVVMLLSILSVVDNPRQDVPLVSAMRSPVWGFTPDELARIRVSKRDGDFWTAVLCSAVSDEKCAAFVRDIERFRSAAPDMTVSELIWHICTETGFFGIAGAMRPDGGAAANIEALITFARGYEKNSVRGLARFLSYVSMLKERGEELFSRAEERNAVRIMSIHKSKGLEFPVVILAGLSKRLNLNDTTRPLLIHPALGVGAKAADRTLRVEYNTAARRAIALKQREETAAEELRVLYVAMTRAREKLVMLATFADAKKELSKLAGIGVPAPPELMRGMMRMSDWILVPALARPEAAALADRGEAETENGWSIRLERLSALPPAEREKSPAERPAEETAADKSRIDETCRLSILTPRPRRFPPS
ncbi:MAG: UvrD-helicase domain-containing protein [Oscillospiraceae bacterium]|nr:UvrD-helicase domain-containing protein [Oscillospiraceae bacterium]